MPDRHPLGRACRDPLVLLAVVLLMPYALTRYAIDECRTRRTRGGRRG